MYKCTLIFLFYSFPNLFLHTSTVRKKGSSCIMPIDVNIENQDKEYFFWKLCLGYFVFHFLIKQSQLILVLE